MQQLQLTLEQCHLAAEWGGWYFMIWPDRYNSIDQYLEKRLRDTKYPYFLRSVDCEFILKWYNSVKESEPSLLTSKDELTANFIQNNAHGIL